LKDEHDLVAASGDAKASEMLVAFPKDLSSGLWSLAGLPPAT
jgi:hypothetical protein